MTLNLTAFL